MKKVLLVGSECVPFIKTGGLADVMGALPKELKAQGVDVRVILPKYGDIPQKYKDMMYWQKNIDVLVGWRHRYCGLEKIELEGITFYFVDNEFYFKRPGIYGFNDDPERFAFFARAVLECLPHIDFQPDVLHCNDWHAGMVAPFLMAHYKHDPFYANMKTLFTIHNLKYQGVFGYEVLGDLLGLGNEWFRPDLLEFHGNVNFMKGGLVCSDLINTVSRTYAEEIQTAEFGEKLEGLLRARSNDLYGIVNGIDYEINNPETDKNIPVNFSVKTLDDKVKNKLELQEELGLPVGADIPMVAMITRLVSAKGFGLVAEAMGEILPQENVQFVVLGTGESQYEHMLWSATTHFPGKVSANIFFDNKLASKIYAASDMFLMPSVYEPCGIGQLLAMRYGSLPIVRETGGLKDTVQSYNEDTGEGNGFSFTAINAHDFAYTIRRALHFYKDQKVWKKIMKNAMSGDFSWKQSAKEYIELYDKLID